MAGQDDLTQFGLGLKSSATTELSLRLAKLVLKKSLKIFQLRFILLVLVSVVCVCNVCGYK